MMFKLFIQQKIVKLEENEKILIAMNESLKTQYQQQKLDNDSLRLESETSNRSFQTQSQQQKSEIHSLKTESSTFKTNIKI